MLIYILGVGVQALPHSVALERIQAARRRRAKHGIQVSSGQVASGPADLLGSILSTSSILKPVVDKSKKDENENVCNTTNSEIMRTNDNNRINSRPLSNSSINNTNNTPRSNNRLPTNNDQRRLPANGGRLPPTTAVPVNSRPVGGGGQTGSGGRGISINLNFWLFDFRYIYLSICLSLYVFFCVYCYLSLSVYLFSCLYFDKFCLSFLLSVFLSTYLSFFV